MVQNKNKKKRRKERKGGYKHKTPEDETDEETMGTSVAVSEASLGRASSVEITAQSRIL